MRIVLLCVMLSAPTFAEGLDVSNLSILDFQTGGSLSFRFSVWNYGANNPGYSPLPNRFGFMALGSPLSGPATDYSFNATLDSLDGSFFLPISISAGPGTLGVQGQTVAVGILQSTILLSPAESLALFGPAGSVHAFVNLENTGAAFTLGFDHLLTPPFIGPHTLGGNNVIMIPDVRGEGPVSTGGLVYGVTYQAVPEPTGLWISAVFSVAIIRYAARRHHAN